MTKLDRRKVAVATARTGLLLLGWMLWRPESPAEEHASGVRVGAAAVEFEADDSMIIAGGIHEGRANGSEGKLRAVAVVLEKEPFGTFAIVANDVLMMTRQDLDPVVEEIGKMTGIPAAHILINCTHTHHAPSTMRLHDYGPVPPFVRSVRAAIVKAVVDATAALSPEPCRLFYLLGREETVGQNSRELLDDGQIYWIGSRTNVVRPTGPFDPELPVLAFKDSAHTLRAVIFNHSTHTIGTRLAGVRSPGFYGLAAQELEATHGGRFSFLQGASGSTHNLTLSGAMAAQRITRAVHEALVKAEPRPVQQLAARKRSFRFRVRHFDEAAEAAAVERYCRKYAPASADATASVFKNMRAKLVPEQRVERETWLQVIQIGDIAIAGVPGECFTQLGLDIKNRSPFRATIVAELANDWIGYLPNLEAHQLGGYQVWTGFHSYAEIGTGERIVDEIVAMLRELKAASE